MERMQICLILKTIKMKIDWKTLRTQYFKECVETIDKSKKVNLAPHDLFEWFRNNIGKSKEEYASEVVKKNLIEFMDYWNDNFVDNEVNILEHQINEFIKQQNEAQIT